MRTGWIFVALLAASAARAQDGTATADKVKQLEKRTKQLEAELEARKQAEASGAADLQAARQRLDTLSEQVQLLNSTGQVESHPEQLPPSLDTRFRGMGNIGLVGDTGNQTPTLELDALQLGWEADAGSRSAFDASLAFSLGDDGTPMAEIDRLQVKVAFSRGLNLQAGKIYSPYGYWNTHIPLGTFEAASFRRPGVLGFERDGASFATRQGGIDLNGHHLAGLWRVGYHAGVGNGRSPHLYSTQDVADTSWEKATWGQLWAQSPGGLQLGVTVAYDPIRPDEGAPVQEGDLQVAIDETLGVAHLAWVTPRTEVLLETFLIMHATPNGDGEYNRAGYLQWSHRYKSATPYLRADYLERWKDDPLYLAMGDVGSQLTGTAGVRRDLSVHAALSGELFGGPRVDYLPTDSQAVFGAQASLAAAF